MTGIYPGFSRKLAEWLTAHISNEEVFEVENTQFKESVESLSKDFRPDPQSIIARIKQTFSDPKGLWAVIQAENKSIREIYLEYILVLAAVPAICGFIGQAVFGINVPLVGVQRVPFFSALIGALVSYGLSLASLYVMAIIIGKISSMFGGRDSQVEGFRLLAYSATPVYVGGLFQIIPALAILGALLSLFSVYLYFQGSEPMMGISKSQRLPFVAVTFVAALILGVVVGSITAMFVVF